MRYLIALLLMTAPALAQQQQQASPSQLAIQIDNAIGVLAQRAEYAEAQVRQLQEQIERLKQQTSGTKPEPTAPQSPHEDGLKGPQPQEKSP